MSVQTTDAAARIQPGQMRATYAIWLKAPGASLHDVVELLERSERPTMTTYRGVPAILLFVDARNALAKSLRPAPIMRRHRFGGSKSAWTPKTSGR